MERLEPEIVIPGHGPVIFGSDRAAQVLGDGAAVVEHLVRESLVLMNQGATLDQVLQAVTAPAECLAKPYLRAKYDDPGSLDRQSKS
jgi:alkyl sulfatase BDS1-like metallo-beta-lactamase superfamily hydrolase